MGLGTRGKKLWLFRHVLSAAGLAGFLLIGKRKQAKISGMEIVILDSAYKHGITKQSILFCLLHFLNDIVMGDPPPKRLFVGFDHRGTLLEIIAIEDEEQDRLVVIHAMKLRKQFYQLLPDGGSV